MLCVKGGTAINLFVRDMPRLSIDIDLVYLPIENREISLRKISEELKSISENIYKQIDGATVVETKLANSKFVIKLLVQYKNSTIKIEVSPVGRGIVLDVRPLEICARANSEFGFAKMQVACFDELYAGKLCAALDRQHPRDLFDVKILLDNEGITEDLIKVFLVYLIACNRPIVELLEPNFVDMGKMYLTDFIGMTFFDVRIEELELSRELLVSTIRSMLTESDKKFLMSFKQSQPDWDLLGLKKASELPAVRWKLHNLELMDSELKKNAISKLEKSLYS